VEKKRHTGYPRTQEEAAVLAGQKKKTMTRIIPGREADKRENEAVREQIEKKKEKKKEKNRTGCPRTRGRRERG
jgi:hypothetical protein